MSEMVCIATQARIRLMFDQMPYRDAPINSSMDLMIGRIHEHIYNPDAADKVGCRECYNYFVRFERQVWGTDEHQTITTTSVIYPD
jgi:hypothetical protein